MMIEFNARRFTRRFAVLCCAVAASNAFAVDLASTSQLTKGVFDLDFKNDGSISLLGGAATFDLDVKAYPHLYSGASLGTTGLDFVSAGTNKWALSLANPSGSEKLFFKDALSNEILGFTFTSATLSYNTWNKRYSFLVSGATVDVGSSGYALDGVTQGTGAFNFTLKKLSGSTGDGLYGATMVSSINDGGDNITPEPFTCGLALAGVGLFVRRRLKK